MSKENSRKNINDVLEASTNIHNRLFNHKHFIDGEINYMINKTEKSDCKEIDQLINQIQDKYQIKSNQIVECKNLINLDKSNEFNRKAENLLKKSNKILNLDQENEEKREQRINDLSRRINEKKIEIELNNQSKLIDVDKLYERKKIELAKYYNELEAKWEI